MPLKNIFFLNCINLIIIFFFIIYSPQSLAKSEQSALLKPPHLVAGDTVGLISSGFRAPEDIQIQFASERLQALGLKVKLGRSVFHRDGYCAGSESERATDINEMFADPTVKAIFEVRGGWGSNQLLNKIDYNIIKQHPKIIIGYSDITSLLLAIHAKTGLVTFHGPLMFEPIPAITVQYLKDVLFTGNAETFKNPTGMKNTDDDLIQTENRIQVINGGIATGPLLGGNLTTLNSMLGTSDLPKFKGAILFVEDVDEDVYKIDRMLTQLQMAGVLNQISGFIFGTCTNCSAGQDTYGSLTLMQVLNRHLKPLHIPAWYGAMIGHQEKIFTLPEGVPVTINADQGTITMLEPAVTK